MLRTCSKLRTNNLLRRFSSAADEFSKALNGEHESLDDSLKLLTEYLEEYPDDHIALNNKGCYLMAQDEYGDASYFLDSARQQAATGDINNAAFLANVVGCQLAMGNLENAAELLQHDTEGHPYVRAMGLRLLLLQGNFEIIDNEVEGLLEAAWEKDHQQYPWMIHSLCALLTCVKQGNITLDLSAYYIDQYVPDAEPALTSLILQHPKLLDVDTEVKGLLQSQLEMTILRHSENAITKLLDMAVDERTLGGEMIGNGGVGRTRKQQEDKAVNIQCAQMVMEQIWTYLQDDWTPPRLDATYYGGMHVMPDWENHPNLFDAPRNFVSPQIAKRMFEQVLAAGPDVLQLDFEQQAVVLQCLGICEHLLGNTTSACRRFSEAIALNSSEPTTYIDYANALEDAGRLPEALQALRNTEALRTSVDLVEKIRLTEEKMKRTRKDEEDHHFKRLD